MADRAKLLDVLRTATAELPDVVEKKMFGCEAMFTTGGIFAMVWKTGRIAVKLTDPARHQALLAQKGAEPWSPGGMKMTAWLLVPPKLETPKALLPWLREAHAMAGAKPKAKPKKAAAAKKAAGAKKSASAKKGTAKKKTARARSR
jgi:TfoX/Sxy family transcriptional regulator of competence genes